MKHHVLCKIKEGVDKAMVIAGARELFGHLTEIDGMHGVEFFTSCVDRPNRYDLMIVIDMDKEALPVYDDSIWHVRWKSEYGQFIESKAIFDCV